jgi:hypothetical protein
MRWALSPIIGNGTATVVVGQEATTGPYRAKSSDHNLPVHIAVIPGNDDGTPKYPWCLVQGPTVEELIAAHPEWSQAQQDAATTRYAAAVADLTADGDIRLLPDWSMDKVLNRTEANAVIAALGKFGITGPDPVNHTVRQVVRYLADQLDVTWNVG